MDTDASRVDQHLLRYSLAELSQHDGSPIARHAILTILHLVRDELQLETLALVTKTETGWSIRYRIDDAGATPAAIFPLGRPLPKCGSERASTTAEATSGASDPVP